MHKVQKLIAAVPRMENFINNISTQVVMHDDPV